MNNEVGNIYGRLTVLRRAKNNEIPNTKEKRAYWVCQCSCGNICIAMGKSLRNGSKKSCGCLQKEVARQSISKYNEKNISNDLTNKKFGKLLVLEKTEKRINRSVVWKCICECGEVCEVTNDCLTNGKTKSCGCLRKEMGAKKLAKWMRNDMNITSVGEKTIIKILKQNNILYEREKQFLDGGKIKNCRFDFYLPKYNIIIEFHGEQHYKMNSFFYKNRSEFTKAQERDRVKISYCLAHNIPIYCIPYWELENLNEFKDLIQEKFLAKTSFHNDDVWRTHQNLR